MNLSKTFKSGFAVGFFVRKRMYQLKNLERGALTKEFIFLFLWILFQKTQAKIMQDSYGKI